MNIGQGLNLGLSEIEGSGYGSAGIQTYGCQSGMEFIEAFDNWAIPILMFLIDIYLKRIVPEYLVACKLKA